MLDAWCDAHHARVLVMPSQILGVESTPSAIVVVFRCVCGAEGIEVVRSRRRDPAGCR